MALQKAAATGWSSSARAWSSGQKTCKLLELRRAKAVRLRMEDAVKESPKMTARSCVLSAGLATVGWLVVGITGASAQAIVIDPYFDPYVDPYPVIVARPRIVAPAPIMRERTIVVTRPAYATVPPVVVRVPRHAYPAEVDYLIPDW
jgi:hypothetical protein